MDPLEMVAKQLHGVGGLIPTLGMELAREGEGVVCRMPVTRAHTGSPGVAHGGAVTALLDTTLGALALMIGLQRERLPSTVELKTNFLRPVREGAVLVARPQLESAGRRLLVISGRAFVEGDEAPVAFALGTFNLYEHPSFVRALSSEESTP